MIPLTVTAHLRTPCVPGGPLLLDGVLLAGLGEAMGAARADGWEDPAAVLRAAEEGALPLARVETPHGWWWAASQAVPLGPEATAHGHRRPALEALERWSSAPSVNIAAGPDKLLRIPVYYRPGWWTVQWTCVGDPERVAALLLRVGALGRRVTHGWGWVERWDVHAGGPPLDQYARDPPPPPPPPRRRGLGGPSPRRAPRPSRAPAPPALPRPGAGGLVLADRSGGHHMSAAIETPPYLVPLDYGWADLEIPGWPPRCGPRVLRGALLAALMPHLPGGEHSDWTGRDEDGVSLDRPPPILYRVHRGRCQVYAVGPRAREHLLALARWLRAVRLPGDRGDGAMLPVEAVTPTVGTHILRLDRSPVHVYRLRTPYFPGRALYERRPHPDLREALAWPCARPTAAHAHRVAWAASAIRRTLAVWLRWHGLQETPNRCVEVQVLEYRDRLGLQWSRPDRGVRDVRHGFSAVFTTNAVLPPGMGLGAHAGEGFGEVWPQ